jgi:hypothetical protein
LKEISYWVKRIVRERRRTNYKEISDVIVEKIKSSDRRFVNVISKAKIKEQR